MRYTIFSSLSIFCLLLTLLLFGYDSTKWYGSFLKFLYDISVLMPFILGGIGIVSALLGIKGEYRFILVVLHSFLLLLFLGIYIKALYGFS
ncbi:hypothetical protein D0439_02895 [Lysinibacillus fusiformis]|nr:hypothetical protein KQ41_23750 [Lysinibacillus fusiformis]QDZ97646.1 hypothetical protein D0439_02895 [Lysinibacillus fusiformis]